MKKKYIAMVVALCATLSVQAGIIFQDDFSGGATELNGTALDVNNQDSQTWRAKGEFLANGTVSGNFQAAAYLDFSPTAGNVYTLSATLSATGINNNWIALGFVRDTSALNIRHADLSNGIDWVLHRNNNNAGTADLSFFAGPGTASGQYSEATTAQSNDYVITLDATDAGNVLMSLNVSGVLRVDEYNAGTLTALDINGVGFSHDSGGVSTFDNFELSVIPEPATLGMVAAFGGGILFVRRLFMMG